jgi:hypothetical protein
MSLSESEGERHITIGPSINQTIVDIVKTGYWEAKRKFENEEISMNCAMAHRSNIERQLASAKSSGAEAARRCQNAADRLRQIKEFMRSAGISV